MAICFEGLAECNTDSGHMLSRLGMAFFFCFFFFCLVGTVAKGHLFLFTLTPWEVFALKLSLKAANFAQGLRSDEGHRRTCSFTPTRWDFMNEMHKARYTYAHPPTLYLYPHCLHLFLACPTYDKNCGYP